MQPNPWHRNPTELVRIVQPLNTTLYADWGRIIASAELIDDGVTYIQEAAVKSLSMAETQPNEEARRSIAAAMQVRYTQIEPTTLSYLVYE